MSKHIYLDVSAAVHSRAGLGRYSARLAEALAAQEPDKYRLFHNGGAEANMPAQLQHLPQTYVNYGYKPWRMACMLAHLSGISFNKLVPDAELFHSTEHLLMPLRNVPTVLTMHDLIFKLFPEYHKKLNYWFLNWAVPVFCNRADHIIAVSQSTKQDLVTHYKLKPEKISVVYEAAASNFSPPTPAQIAYVKQKYQLPEQFLVHLSTIEPRKNLLRLLDSLIELRKQFPALKLVLVGAKGWLFDDFFAKIEAEGLSDVVVSLGWVDDEDLAAVLASASLAVQPSLYEGFGLPLLEHMASGQVVAASNVSSLPEVGGESAVYFDPTNTADMTATIARLLSDRDEYAHRRELGFAQANTFSWDRAARETRAVYNSLLGDSGN